MSAEPGVEYFGATAAEERDGGSGSEGLRSLASWLGVPLAAVLELRDAGKLAAAVETRNRARCTDPVEARRHLERRCVPG